MVDLRVELHLPGLTIAVDKVVVNLPRRGKKQAGPFTIVSRESGHAIDTALHSDPNTHVIGQRAHSGAPQLWYLRPSGEPGRVMIVSADNGFSLDCDDGASDPHPRMVLPTGKPSQLWIVEAAPDGVGHTIESAYNHGCLASREHFAIGYMPYFSNAKGAWRTQWVISQPVGRPR